MKSTLYLKFILLYIILGFLSIFTVASLSSTLTTHYLESSISGNMYQSANLLASNYLPDYFSKTIALADVYTQLNGMSDYLNSDIWFVDNEGSLLASAKSGDVSYAPSRIENFDPAESGGSTDTDIAFDRFQDTADRDCRIQVCCKSNMRKHRRCGCLTVCTGYSNRCLIVSHKLTE